VATVTVTGFLFAFEDVEAPNTAEVDPDGLIVETSEGNNSVTITTSVLAQIATPTRPVARTPTPTRRPLPQGDVTGDGVVDSLDALWVLMFDARLVDELPVPGTGDADKDGLVNSFDALLILQLHVGAIDHLPP